MDPKKLRCALCARKISELCPYECRCGKLFCPAHLHFRCHDCTYDYKMTMRPALEKVVASKMKDHL